MTFQTAWAFSALCCRLCFLSLLLLSSAAYATPQPYLQKPVVMFRPLPTVADPKPMNPHVRYVGGYELTAKGTSALTGLSDLQVLPDGEGLRIEAVSDLGAIARFEMKPDDKGGYADSALDIFPFLDTNAQPYDHKMLADAEDMAVNPLTQDRYVSFEGLHRVMKYKVPHIWRSPGARLPLSGLPNFPANEGMEGLAYISDAKGDALLVGAESGGFWRCGLALNMCSQIEGPPAPGFLYKLTSLAVLDQADPKRNHDILALYRYYDPFNGPHNRLRLLRLDGDKLTVAADLAKIAAPLPFDNYEGVAAVKTPSGYRLYLICDGLHEDDKPKILVFDWKL
ncbi:MAG: esterase-like activity of phytase family protein [Asticcacaulis sp.]